MTARFSQLLLSLSLLLALPVFAQTPGSTAQRDHMQVELLADHSQVSPGQTFYVAFRLSPEAGWHSYWLNSGDSGLPTRLQWQLPDGVTAGEIIWPAPNAEPVDTLMNYGFSQPHSLLVPVALAADSSAETIRIGLKAKWLVCADVCIPQRAELQLDLPVGGAIKNAKAADVFAASWQQVPTKADAINGLFSHEGDVLQWQFTGAALDFRGWTELRWFPAMGRLIDHAATQDFLAANGQLDVQVPASPFLKTAPDAVRGVLRYRDPQGSEQAIWLKTTLSKTVLPEWSSVYGEGAVRSQALGVSTGGHAESLATKGVPSATVDSQPTAPTMSLWLALASAFIAGLILNLMPCVLPVLSLKALAIAESQGLELKQQRAHAMSYGVGVVLSFLVVAGLLIALRQGGQQIGWGFQLQQPLVIAGLIYLLFALGLSLSGVVLFGQNLMGVGQELTEKPGLRGSFFTGVLAVVVASPCTAPFMGAAIGWAMAQPVVIALLVFGALGLGMAAPLMLLAWWPWLGRVLPKPGAWMETFKQLLAFPLYLTAVWLAWVLGQQAGLDGLAWLLAGLVLLSLALWLWGLRQAGRAGSFASVAALLIFVTALLPLWQVQQHAQNLGDYRQTKSQHQAYSPTELQALVAAKKPVFIDMTAAWCVTCQINERVALRQPEVQAAFNAKGVVQMVGDWTNYDPAITEFLENFGRTGVPLYVLFDRNGQPMVLPQVLTPSIVLDELAKL